MKTARFWLLLMLCVLLPVRGTVAASMLCDGGRSGVQQELRLHGSAAGNGRVEPVHVPADAHAHLDAAAASPAGHSGAHHSGADHGSPEGAGDKCNLCSASCSLTLLVGVMPALVAPRDLTEAVCAAPGSPPLSFVLEGQERPPRIR